MLRGNRPFRRTHRSLSGAVLEVLETRCLLSANPTIGLSLAVSPAATVSGNPSNLSPAMIRQAYDLTNLSFVTNGTSVAANGAGETIAIVDAFADPNIVSDLQTFDANFGLSDNAANGQFALTVQTPEGPAATNSGWATEESLDVEWAHAIAPGANIMLVEAPSATVSSLTGAVTWAKQQTNVVAVSMSWGNSPEFSGETSYDSIFTSGTHGVTYIAASGDNGVPNYPSTSPNVLAVGGTTLNVDSNGNWLSETAWSGSGGGQSPYENTNKPDVAWDGDPSTGFLVYDSLQHAGLVGWQVVGGTSAGSPQWAALVAIADQGRALRGLGSLDGATQTIPDLYALPSSDYNNVTPGGLTGLGSPDGEKVLAALVGGGITVGAPVQLAFGQQPTEVEVNGAISLAITVKVEDAAGDVVVGDNSTVTLSVGSGPGSLGGTVTAQAVNGVATFNNVSLNAAGSYTLNASDGSLSGATSNSFNVDAGRLVFTQQPGSSVAGEVTPAFEVAVENGSGNVITSDNSTVTVAVASGPGGASGTLTAHVSNGVATFSNVVLNAPGSYKLSAADGADSAAMSSTFSVAAPQLVFKTQPSNVIAGIAIAPAVQVMIEDSNGNLITSDNSTVTLAVDTGPGSLAGTTSVQASGGIATFSHISIATAGSYTLIATDGSDVHAISSNFSVTGPGYIDQGNMDWISGWAYDPAHPSNSVSIEVDIQNGPSQTFTANETRSDLQGLIGSSSHGFYYATPMLSAGIHLASIYAIMTNGTKVLIGTSSLLSQNSLFDEHYYLTKYPDVAAAVKAGTFATGYDHYLQYGQYEGRNPNPYWVESWYLQQNPDVAAAVKAGTVSSGFMNYYLYGQFENRPGLLYFDTTYYLANNPDVAGAISAGQFTSAFEHFVLFGQYDGRSPMKYFISSYYDAFNSDILPFVTGETFTSDYEQFIEYGQFEDRLASPYYNEKTYLADNPDVKYAVHEFEYPDGFQQWLEYGQYEGRTAV
jgi:hypothetical protein